VLVVLLLVCADTSLAEVLHFSTPVTPQEMVKRMGTGVDATWSEFPSKIADYTTAATAAFADKGFKHLRMRVAEDSAPASWAYLDQQVQDALDYGLIPIIANQSHAFEDNPSAETQADWVQWWEDMAAHYKDYPYELMFDLIIEIAARSTLSTEPIDQLNQAYEQAVSAIRNTGGNNGRRIIIFSAHKRSDPTKMSQLAIPSQGRGYLIGEFHEGYASGPSPDTDSPHYYWNGTAAEIALMSGRADAAIAWSTETGIPVWEGAWMPGNYNKGDDYDINRQIAFATDFIAVLNERNIPHAINATHKFYELSSNTWTHLEPVVDAIIALDITANNPVSNDPVSTFQMNPGLNDAWYYPGTNGQGFFITVFPAIEHVLLSWFTYDTERPGEGVSANLGEPGHRWFNALGAYSGNRAVLDISIASGGIFDTPTEIKNVNDGTIILTFTDCENGTVEYDIPSIDQQGIIPIQRVADDNVPLCEALIPE
jgi:hypothetical protein